MLYLNSSCDTNWLPSPNTLLLSLRPNWSGSPHNVLPSLVGFGSPDTPGGPGGGGGGGCVTVMIGSIFSAQIRLIMYVSLSALSGVLNLLFSKSNTPNKSEFSS